MALLSEKQISAGMKTIKGWKRNGGAIYRVVDKKNFVQAMGFVQSVALLAEKMDHHPEWFNVYKTVEVTLSTHDAGGVTELDIKLAEAMDRLVERI